MQGVMYAYGYNCGINSATWYLGLVATFFVDACKPAHMGERAKHGLMMYKYNNQTWYTVNEYQNHRLHSAIDCLLATSVTDSYATNYALLLFRCEK